MTPIFELKVSTQAVSANRMFAGAILIFVIFPLVVFFSMKVIKPSLARVPVNTVGVTIGIAFVSLIVLIGGFLVWGTFRNSANRPLVTLYDNGAKIGDRDVLVPYDEVSADILSIGVPLQGIVLPTGQQIEVKSIKDKEIKVTAVIHDKTGIPKDQVDEFLRILSSKKHPK